MRDICQRLSPVLQRAIRRRVDLGMEFVKADLEMVHELIGDHDSHLLLAGECVSWTCRTIPLTIVGDGQPRVGGSRWGAPPNVDALWSA